MQYHGQSRGMAERGIRMKKKMRIRQMAGAGLLLMLCMAACGKQEVDLPEGDKVQATPGEVPTGTPTAAPEPTKMPTGTPALTPTITPTAVPTEQAEEDLTFATVTPVPFDAVQSIAGTMTRGEFPAVDGSTATIPLSEAVYCLVTGEDAEAAKEVINHTKTTNSYTRLYSGEVDLLIVYEPSASIIRRMQTEPLTIKPIGLDALVFMANAANPVESLTSQQLVEIYAGRVSDWTEVGGKNQEMRAFQRPEGSGSQTLMQKLVMGDTPMAEGDNIYRYSTMADILEGMLNFTGDDNTLGYSVYYYASQMYHLPDLKFMGVDGVLPSTQTIYDGSYPYTNAFYAVIRPDEPEDSGAHRIFDWLTGQEGQQMVLDLGYVPVIMPDGAQIGDGMAVAGGAKEIELSPTADLEEGQHFIFFQKQNVSWEYDYGKVIVYDHKWNKCVTFYNAMVGGRGVWDGRYLSVDQYRAKPDGGEEYISRIYDLQEQCFLEDEWFEGAWLVDSVRGYFGKYPTEEERREKDGDEYREWCKVYNAAGEILLDDVPMYEGYMCMHQEGGCYVQSNDMYIMQEDGSAKYYRIYHIYDLDLNLKQVACSGAEVLPDENERQPGVRYFLYEERSLLSKTGDLILDAGKFLERFGDGENMECVMVYKGYPSYEFDDYDPEKLFAFQYKDKLYYTDRTMSFLWIEGEESGTLVDRDGADLPYYFVAENAGEGKKSRYFMADGSPALMQDGTVPTQMLSYGDGYALVSIQTDGVTVEEHLPKEDFVGTYHYPAPNYPARPDAFGIYYLGSHGFMIRDYILGAEGLGEEDEEVSFYQAEEKTVRYTAKNVSVSKQYCQNHSVMEGWWLTLDNGISLVLEGESERYDGKKNTEEVSLRRYGLLKEGGISFLTGQATLEACGDGYAQFTVGNYDIVYDADGNMVLRAMNRALELD